MSKLVKIFCFLDRLLWLAVITWGDGSCGPALLMVLPIFLLITLALIAMYGAGSGLRQRMLIAEAVN